MPRKGDEMMGNEFAMYLSAKGGEGDLTALKRDILKHSSAIGLPCPDAGTTDYRVDLAAWNPKREDWIKQRLSWWLELRKGQPELVPVENGELRVIAGATGAPPLHFLDGLRELYPDLELSACSIDLSGEAAEEWKCSPEGTFCVEEVFPCWEGEIVGYWKKDGRVMIKGGKPVAEELQEYAGNPFVLVDGVPLSITLDAAKEHVRKLAEKSPYFLERLLCEWPQVETVGSPFDSRVDDDRPASPEDWFFLELKKLYRTQLMRRETK
jgi:hypothetical protein